MAIAQLLLTSGRDVALVRLEVASAGAFLEGYPSARWNDMKLAALADSVTKRYPHAGTHVLSPTRIHPDPPGTPDGPFGPVELLPALQCIGVFESHPISTDADPVLTQSTLVVAWYQPEPDLPFDDTTRRVLQTLDWNLLARDHDR